MRKRENDVVILMNIRVIDAIHVFLLNNPYTLTFALENVKAQNANHSLFSKKSCRKQPISGLGERAIFTFY
jgi:hypothetical protein